MSMVLKRVRSERNLTNQRQPKVVPVGCALRPSLDFLLSLQVMPCLTTLFVQKTPSLDICSVLFDDRSYRRAVVMLMVAAGIANQDFWLRPRHLCTSRGILKLVYTTVRSIIPPSQHREGEHAQSWLYTAERQSCKCRVVWNSITGTAIVVGKCF